MLPFPAKSLSSQVSLTPHAIPRHLLKQGDLLPAVTVAYSFTPCYRGKPPAGKGTRQGIGRHVTAGIAKKLLPFKESEAVTPVPPRAGTTPLEMHAQEKIGISGNQEGSPVLVPPPFLASQQRSNFGRVSSQQQAPSLSLSAEEKRTAKAMERRAKNNDF